MLKPQVSEKEACSLASAIWQEVKDVPDASSLPSADLIRKATSLAETGHENRLGDVFEECGLSANIPLSYIDVGCKQQHPIFKIRDFLHVLSHAGKTELLFHGHTESNYRDFWELWRLVQPQHPIFRHHGRAGNLGCCVPVLAYADEGTSQKRRGLMVVQYQPILASGSTRAEEINMTGNSLLNRFLYAVMTARTYSGKLLKNKPLLSLIESFAKELGSLFHEPVQVQWGKRSRNIYLICLGLKGDLAALVKLGQLDRSFMRETPSKPDGAGICHLCRGGQANCPWHNVSYSNMSAMRKGRAPPWKQEPSLVAHIPQSAEHKAEFFRIDLFHCAHKGVWGDAAANTIATLQIL